MYQTSTNITPKYRQETRYNYVQNSGFVASSFTGKERDSETGLSYFGARYYDSDLMTSWLSVDPMADKYPNLSPYAYCAWNPVKLVDPDGEEIAFAGNEEEKAYYQYRNIIFSNKKYSHIQREISNLENAKEVFRIRLNGNVSNEKGGGNFVYNKETNEFDINIMEGGDFNTIEKLSHELKHADQYMNRKLILFISSSGHSSFSSDSYSIDDELEAYGRQGMFGNTLTKDEVLKKYHKTGLSWYGQNKQYKPSNDAIQTNMQYQEHFGHPRVLYHGWENDIDNSQ